MSTGQRAYDLLRGYVNREWDRIHGVDPFANATDKSNAASEVDSALEHPAPRHSTSNPDLPSSRPNFVPEPFEPKARACKVLGIASDAPFFEIRRAFERLNKRADPANFPVGSPEAYQAAQIQRRVQEAYKILTAGMDASELRFRSLEID